MKSSGCGDYAFINVWQRFIPIDLNKGVFRKLQLDSFVLNSIILK